MNRVSILIISLIFAVSSAPLSGEVEFGDEVPPLEAAPPLANTLGEGAGRTSGLVDDVAEAQLLDVDLRMDILFSGGKAVEQGFSINSIQFGATGELARFIDYRFALGPTREFSSALLPQGLPVSAWVRARNNTSTGMGDESTVWAKVGLFTPSQNPWWSPNLSDLPLPDYSRVHRALLINRDIGFEVTFRPLGDSVEISGGVFNGSGIVSQNTNNSKAFTGAVSTVIGIGSWSTVLGLGGYSKQQSDVGSVNFINDWVANLFLVLESPQSGLLFGFDILSGKLEDSTRSLSVFGGTVTLFLTLDDWVKAMARLETLKYSPELEPEIEHAQIGPVFMLTSSLNAFLYYEYVKDKNGIENSIQIMVRLNI